MSRRTIPALAVAAALAAVAIARADELRLKDGTKITGTIVGFENDSFKVETTYGYALVRKDKVADINISAAKKEPEPKAKTNTPAPAPPAAPAAAPAAVKDAAATASAPAAVNTSAIERPAATANPSLAPVHAAKSPAPAVKIDAAAAPPPAPTAPPEPPAIRDEVRGNLYVNHTYGFQMYKPPSWDLIPGARKALPDAVAALGTSDETTLLVIGRERAQDSLDAHAAATEKALQEIYVNYRLISSRHTMVAGFPAIEARIRGTADGRDWSVTLLTLTRGNDAFTLLGMTWADSDLIQVQENVIARTVNSLTFGPP